MATHTHTPDPKAPATRPDMSVAMLSIMQCDEPYDLITLAQDALGEGPEYFCEMFLVNCEVQLAEALRIIRARKARLIAEGAA